MVKLTKDWQIVWGNQTPPTVLDEAHRAMNAENKAMDDVNSAILKAQNMIPDRPNKEVPSEIQPETPWER